jgi:hypothetical protein
MNDIPPQECYHHLGFSPYSGGPEKVDAPWWRQIRDSKNLEDMRMRYITMRDKAGWPIIDEGYVVGSIPALTIASNELEKILSALTEGIARGCQTLKQWQELRQSSRE